MPGGSPCSLASSNKPSHCSHAVGILWETFSNYPAACTNLPITFLGRTEIASENTSIFPYIGVIKFGLKDNSRQNDVYLCVFNGSINSVFVCSFVFFKTMNY